MAKLKNLIIVLVLLASAGIVPVTATPIDDIRSLLSDLLRQAQPASVYYGGGSITTSDGQSYNVYWSSNPSCGYVGIVVYKPGVSPYDYSPYRSYCGNPESYPFKAATTSQSDWNAYALEQMNAEIAASQSTPAPTSPSTPSPTTSQTPATAEPTPVYTSQPTVTVPTNPAIIPTDVQIIPSEVSAVTGVKQSPGFGIIAALGLFVLIARLRR